MVCLKSFLSSQPEMPTMFLYQIHSVDNSHEVLPLVGRNWTCLFANRYRILFPQWACMLIACTLAELCDIWINCEFDMLRGIEHSSCNQLIRNKIVYTQLVSSVQPNFLKFNVITSILQNWPKITWFYDTWASQDVLLNFCVVCHVVMDVVIKVDYILMT